MYLDGSRIVGAASMPMLDVGENLRMFGLQITGPRAKMLLDGVRVGGALYLEDAHVDGPVSMTIAEVNANLRCRNLSVEAFCGDGLRIKGALHWLQIANPGTSELTLDRAAIGELHDDRNSWPSKGKLSITAARFEKLTLVDVSMLAQGITHDPAKAIVAFSAADRVEWLYRQDDFNKNDPRQWFQLARLHKNDGDEAASRWVISQLRRSQAAQVKRREWRAVLLGLAWLERDPLLVAVPILTLSLLGSLFFWSFRARFAPTGSDAFRAAYSKHTVSDTPPAYPRFSPLPYSIENTLPGIRLGQDDKWAPDARLGSDLVYWLLVSVRVFLIVSGWALGIALVAAISSRFQR